MIMTAIKSDFIGGIKMFYVCLLHAIFAWMVVAPVVAFVLQKVLLVSTSLSPCLIRSVSPV
jgi:low affinity Fe/Cu permease